MPPRLCMCVCVCGGCWEGGGEERGAMGQAPTGTSNALGTEECSDEPPRLSLPRTEAWPRDALFSFPGTHLFVVRGVAVLVVAVAHRVGAVIVRGVALRVAVVCKGGGGTGRAGVRGSRALVQQMLGGRGSRSDRIAGTPGRPHLGPAAAWRRAWPFALPRAPPPPCRPAGAREGGPVARAVSLAGRPQADHSSCVAGHGFPRLTAK